MKTNSQNSAILAYLKAGNKLTPLKALNLFGCFRLSGRIYELKAAGHQIKTEIIDVVSQMETKKVAQYFIEAKEQSRAESEKEDYERECDISVRNG